MMYVYRYLYICNRYIIYIISHMYMYIWYMCIYNILYVTYIVYILYIYKTIKT